MQTGAEQPQQQLETVAKMSKIVLGMDIGGTKSHAILADEKDQKLFTDYLITNIKLYFDKWEKELGNVVEPTTDEYEAEKVEDEFGEMEAAGEIDAEDHCPQTYQLAQGLLADVDNLLRKNRYASEDANQKAIETAYQGRHAIHLTPAIVSLQEDDKNWENLILSFETMVDEIGEKFDEKLRFDSGFKGSFNTILTRITLLQEDNQRLINENETLQEELQLFKEKATTSTAELERKQNLEAKIDKIKAMFSLNEAKVIYDGDNLIIRLYGLNFQSGKSVILPEYFSLLRKVKDSIKEFPESHILLEGHTDTRGNTSTNKRLSEERAKSVMNALITNYTVNADQLGAYGVSSLAPVASNKTDEGKAKNRRVEIVEQ